MSTEAKKAGNARHIAKLDLIKIQPYKEEGTRIREAAKAAGMSVQGYILQAVRIYMETAGQSATPSEGAQRPTEAVTASMGETTPPQTETPSEAHRGRTGVVMGSGASESGEGEQVTSSPTHDLNSTEAEKLPSEYTYADFEAMDDEAFQRFVKMSGQELGRYLQNVGWPDSTKVIGRWERAQRLEKQRRQRELDYN